MDVRKIGAIAGLPEDDTAQTEKSSQVQQFDLDEARQLVKQLRTQNKGKVSLSEKESKEQNENFSKLRKDTSVKEYVLNKTKSLNKKLSATERDNVDVIDTGGGLKIILNTGTYELLKLVADQYFGESRTDRKCKIVEVQDRSGRLIETQYKLTADKNSVYTLNCYHTTSSCLANGKHVNVFKNEDLPAMIKRIESLVRVNGTDLTSVNDQFHTLITNCRNGTMESNRNGDDNDVVSGTSPCDSGSECSLKKDKIENTNEGINLCDEECLVHSNEEESKDQGIVFASVETGCQTEFPENELLTMMKKLYSEYTKTREDMNCYTLESRREFSYLRDEIMSIRRLISHESS